MTYSCLPGQVVTGLHVAWEPSPVAPFTNLATGEWSGDSSGVQRDQLFLSGGFNQLRPSSCSAAQRSGAASTMRMAMSDVQSTAFNLQA